jgi:hypothetical protein
MKRPLTQSSEERERPHEWLRSLTESPVGLAWLLGDSASLGVAAYRLARAVGRIQPVANHVPTSTELWAAARRIAVAAGGNAPSHAVLLDECRLAGLLVIAPLSRRAA